MKVVLKNGETIKGVEWVEYWSENERFFLVGTKDDVLRVEEYEFSNVS